MSPVLSEIILLLLVAGVLLCEPEATKRVVLYAVIMTSAFILVVLDLGLLLFKVLK